LSPREKVQIMDADGIRRALTRIAHEILEKNAGTEDLVLIGIRRRGVPLARRISERIKKIE
jgi:pyrimidine operon attenuation protein/uracil phosphoribosyltransferase